MQFEARGCISIQAGRRTSERGDGLRLLVIPVREWATLRVGVLNGWATSFVVTSGQLEVR